MPSTTRRTQSSKKDVTRAPSRKARNGSAPRATPSAVLEQHNDIESMDNKIATTFGVAIFASAALLRT